ncbi:HEPN family nuclease [Sulfitobacter sp. F26204]|uniref:HEPN family nuclease n=1 Tax=Sulfitobacter sp. F26204 TaxID=2996014 RepID=UPI00225DF8A7|nr:HEPN family nuclease [Sulfitobacter sp. F26204]MCX7560359.1 HEPN family nuclease [Sulfitobacter sp. F26204]
MLDLPGLAYLEQQIISEAIRVDSWAEAVTLVEKNFDLPQGALGNGSFRQSRTISLLYCLVLVPREVFWQDLLLSEELANADKSWRSKLSAKDFAALNSLKITGFLYLVRNSVAHADYSFLDQSIIFENKMKKVKLEISIRALEFFLEIVGATIATYSTARKNKVV